MSVAPFGARPASAEEKAELEAQRLELSIGDPPAFEVFVSPIFLFENVLRPAFPDRLNNHHYVGYITRDYARVEIVVLFTESTHACACCGANCHSIAHCSKTRFGREAAEQASLARKAAKRLLLATDPEAAAQARLEKRAAKAIIAGAYPLRAQAEKQRRLEVRQQRAAARRLAKQAAKQ